MNIFKPVPDPDFAFAVCRDDDDYAKLEWPDGADTIAWWKPVAMELVEEEDDCTLQSGSLISTSGLNPIFAEALAQGFAKEFAGECEFGPVDFGPDGPQGSMLFARPCDALDEQNSEVLRFADGSVMAIPRLVFCGDALAGRSVFCLPFERKVVFFLQQAVDWLAEQGAKGLLFESANHM